MVNNLFKHVHSFYLYLAVVASNVKYKFFRNLGCSLILRSFALLAFLLVLAPLRAQQDTVYERVPLEILQAGDLVFHTDTNRLKIISTGRFSKNLEELPLEVYVISHEEILKNQYNTLIDVLNSLVQSLHQFRMLHAAERLLCYQ